MTSSGMRTNPNFLVPPDSRSQKAEWSNSEVLNMMAICAEVQLHICASMISGLMSPVKAHAAQVGESFDGRHQAWVKEHC